MLEKNISHGVIPNIHPTLRINNDGRIDYPSGNSLIWSRDDAILKNGFYFDCYSKGRRIRLNDLIDYGEWIFVPVKSGFYVKLREDGKDKQYPEIQLSIPKLRASELEILAALHEVGHARYYNDVHDSVSKGQLLDLKGAFAEQLIQVDGLLSRVLGSDYEEVLEILAWKNALLADWRLSILRHFTDAEKSAFIRKRLGNYLGVTKALWTD